jgi:hypothetical protein
MQLGDAASWASAIGTVGALGFTAYTVRRQVDRERRADDYQRRIYARRVSVTIENLRTRAEVFNGGPDTIYNVGVYIRARSSGSVILHGSGLQNFICPSAKQNFSLVRTDPSDSSIPDSVCFAQFTDTNGYRWNRYMMGLLEEVEQMPAWDSDKGRAHVKLVSLSVAEEPYKSFDVVNDGPNAIYKVRVYTVGKSSDEVVADTGAVVEAMVSGEHRRFDLVTTDAISATPEDVYCIAEFVDINGRWWKRYMLGRIEEIGPMAALVRRHHLWPHSKIRRSHARQP